MKYMIVESYRLGPAAVYERAAVQGRMLPPGLAYLDSWVDARRLDRCFQIMETDDEKLLQDWMAAWSDLIAFEVVPVISSSDAATRSRTAGIRPPERQERP